MTGGTVPHTAAVGALVRDTARGCEAVLTDAREGLPYLSRRYSGGLTERGTWEAS